MSASLVGSEMCIRDRPSHFKVACSDDPNRLIPQLDSNNDFFRNRTIKAVSYTHLTLPTICSV
eukprot:11891960-Alexandrium_andersonii.AAC.1